MRDPRTHARVVPVAIAAAAGMLLAREAGITVQALALAGFLAVHRLRSELDTAWLAALGFATGALLALPEDPQSALPAGAGLVRIEGRVHGEVGATAFGATRMRVRLRGRPVDLRVTGRVRPPSPGDRVSGTAWFDPPGPRGGPGRLRARADTVRLHPAAPGAARLRVALLTWLEATFRRNLGQRTAPLVLRLLLGRGRDLAAQDLRNHRAAGLAHLLAISGLHAVIVASLVGFLLARAIRSPGRRRIALALFLLGYAWLTGFRPPVVRAAFGYFVWRWCRDCGHAFSVASAMAFTTLVTIVLLPDDLGSVSFCLSYFAVAGIATLQPLLTPLLTPPLRHPLARQAATALAVSVAAQLATAALGLLWFGYLTPWGILLSPVAIPIVAAMLFLAIVLAFLAPLAPELAAAGFRLLDAIGDLYLEMLDVCATLPACPVHPLGTPPAPLVVALLGAGCAAAFLVASRRLFLATLVLATIAYFVPAPRPPRRSFDLLAVGHGQAALLVTPAATIAIDCGDSSGGGFAARRLRARLHERGATRIDHLVLTHGDADHASGLSELLLQVRVGRVWLPENPHSAAHVRVLRRTRVPFTIVLPGTAVSPSRGCRIHAPLENADLASSNDGALLVDLALPAGPRIVVTGDQEDAGIVAVRAAVTADPRRCDVLVLPHHAAVTPRLPLLLAALEPAVCLASTSQRKSLAAFRGELARHRPLATGECGDIAIEETAAGRFVTVAERRVW